MLEERVTSRDEQFNYTNSPYIQVCVLAAQGGGGSPPTATWRHKVALVHSSQSVSSLSLLRIVAQRH